MRTAPTTWTTSSGPESARMGTAAATGAAAVGAPARSRCRPPRTRTRARTSAPAASRRRVGGRESSTSSLCRERCDAWVSETGRNRAVRDATQLPRNLWRTCGVTTANEVAAPIGRGRGGGLYVRLSNHGRPPRASRPGTNSPRNCLVVADDQAHQGRKTGRGPAGPQDPQRERSSLVRCTCAAARGLPRPRHLPVQRPLVLEPGRREALTGARRDLRLGPRHVRAFRTTSRSCPTGMSSSSTGGGSCDSIAAHGACPSTQAHLPGS